MHIEEYREYCISKKGVTEEFPFDNRTLVFKVMGKMFALTDVDDFESINLKTDPDIGEELRAQFTAIQPGYHMNKRLWITVATRGDVGDVKIRQLIDASYYLVLAGLPKRVREELDKQ
ncbi:MAG: MmcQ/YjbR family DNA-binding protein [Flavobacteriales bacterium]|jgi:predicted DNA-binding protein (MmcQ/YjbR family)|nr:MmcQ/YjbR family DNA-binding protein [Flavobacteriales bacterium]